MRRIGLVVVPQFQVMSLLALSVFDIANLRAGRSLYEVSVISEDGGPVEASFGMCASTQPARLSELHTVFVGASLSTPPLTDRMRELLVDLSGKVERMASICLGAFLLAEAGLLDGRRATTHWAFLDRFRDRYPAVSVESDCIFVRDGALWSSAGMSTAMDMALAMLEEDLGPDAALQVAKDLVLERWRRSGSQPQSSVLIDHPARSNRIHDVITHIRANLGTELTVDKLADVARMSKRQFTRRFKDETGLTPAKAVERIRLETARDFVTSSSWTIDTIARETGYADTERMRRSFVRAFGHPPQALRRQRKPEHTDTD
ncbi:GlxA family transcriptional regulator [Burkholderia sp. AU18528]|uniref:GlxA family transcriptional regulator n=1 Tax=Burkholderia anthinoferrum TaxID=3090833 RepID=A0ABU5WXB7_9BURK|nr:MULTISPECIES: GlxA family transcriptional regulator [Burkholderia]MEB2502433.1 GlxA family transcriptional regulator [Burkholderia anthinoferrum]MEB2534603.1 GlxA family transcriptional regulator [Burkholderia anthinoferrum]MEB2563276.1 GlxA family transcriptional regulator [Burkholderia anthinoferrum]MEB2583559.1 GlxA family transcriptional regulator [Burkholderia anthinoferrum]KWH65344.1 AraC family transcriptional regulator [Burkholderia anthina]